VSAPTRTARRRAATRALLVDAAQELFAEQGFESTRINEITERADVGFGSFYNHFDSKDTIAAAVIERAVEAHASAVDELTKSLQDPAEVMAVAHRYFVRMASSDPAWAWLLVRLNVSHHVMVHILGARATRDLRSGVEAGRFHIDSAPVALMGFGGALLGVMRGVLDGACATDADIHHATGVLRMLGLPPEDAAEVASRPMPSLPAEPAP
jgi:AcrR family transcriptional regulator